MFNQSRIKLTVWKRYIDVVFSLCDISKQQDIDLFMEQANNTFHPTIKFTAEISEKKIFFRHSSVQR